MFERMVMIIFKINFLVWKYIKKIIFDINTLK
jgi:hypothetical protein